MPKITLINCHGVGAGGDGFHVVGDWDATFTNCSAKEVAGDAFKFIDGPSLIQQLNLPAEADPRLLAELLETLAKYPVTERQAIVERSGFFSKLKQLSLDSSSLIANTLTIAAATNLPEIIRRLTAG